MSAVERITGARIVTRRTLEWADTDAAGHNHFTVAFRWMEEVEHELRRAIGLPRDLTGGIPRVHVEVDYRDRVWFGEEVQITMGVVAVGGTSCTFAWQVDRLQDGAPSELVIEGSHVVVHAPDASATAVPWPDAYRAALTGR
jgi:acyl-CoA thioester hydrolase